MGSIRIGIGGGLMNDVSRIDHLVIPYRALLHLQNILETAPLGHEGAEGINALYDNVFHRGWYPRSSYE